MMQCSPGNDVMINLTPFLINNQKCPTIHCPRTSASQSAGNPLGKKNLGMDSRPTESGSILKKKKKSPGYM